MTDESTLLPPVRLIHESLSRNQRQRRRLRTLLRLAVEAADDQHRAAPHDHQPEAARRQGGMAP